jgi:hypothetical protein
VLPSPVSDGFKQALHWHIKDFSPREVSAAAQRMTDYADAAILELPGEELGQRIEEKHRLEKSKS